MDRMIRLDNKFIYKDKSKYYLTEITNLSEWKNMSDSDKKKAKGKDVTSKVKRLLKKYKRHSVKQILIESKKPLI